MAAKLCSQKLQSGTPEGRPKSTQASLPGVCSRLTSLAVRGSLTSRSACFGVLRRSATHDARAHTPIASLYDVWEGRVTNFAAMGRSYRATSFRGLYLAAWRFRRSLAATRSDA